MKEKPTLMQLRRQLGIDTKQVSDAAFVPLREVYLMEIGVATANDTAVKIMNALSRLAGK